MRGRLKPAATYVFLASLVLAPTRALAQTPPEQSVIRASMKAAIDDHLTHSAQTQRRRARSARDPIWDGIAKGAVVGLLAGVFLTGGGDQCTGMSRRGCIVVTTGLWAAIGGAIDLLHERASRDAPPGGPEDPPLRASAVGRR